MELYYQAFLQEKTTLVIIHGLLGNADNWRSFGKRWTQAGLQVVAIDQRNHGFSFHSDEHNYNLLAEDLHHFLTHHQIESPILLGHSMGAKTVLQYIALYPEKAQKLILADMSPRAYSHHLRHETTMKALLDLDLERLKTRKEVEAQLLKNLEEGEKKLQSSDPKESLGISVFLPFLMKNLYWKTEEKLAFRNNILGLKNNIDQILAPIDFTGIQIQQPTLLLRGGKSDYVSEDDILDYQGIFTDLTVETFEKSGHWLQAQEPNRFYEKVLYFCQK